MQIAQVATWHGRLPVLALVLAFTGCSDPLAVHTPDVLQPDQLANADGALTLAAGAEGSFFNAFGSYAFSPFIIHSGIFADELFGTTLNVPYRNADARTAQEPDPQGLGYRDLHGARINLQDALKALRQYGPSSSSRIGQMHAYQGFIKIFFGEHMCSGIPLSTFVNSVPIYTEPLTTEALYEGALVDFDSAAVYAANDADLANLLLVGRGRTLLDLGRFADAAIAVSAVPSSFRYMTRHSTSSFATQSAPWTVLISLRWVTVPERKGINGINWRSANDPRVPLQDRKSVV